MLRSLETLNRVFEAGIAITALSLFLRALTFNLRDRVSRAFAVILACIMVSSAGEAVSGSLAANVEFWLHFQWVGTIFLPAAYFLSVLSPTATKPNALINLAYVGAVVLAIGLIVLGVGLL